MEANSSLKLASRKEEGSSRRSRLASWQRHRARLTLCFSPPESSLKFLLARWLIPACCIACWTLALLEVLAWFGGVLVVL